MSEIDVKVITIGAATQDVFLTGKALTAKRDVREHNWIEVFPLGAKLELEGVIFDTGGGASNAAVTFARQGLKVSFAGKIGHDPAGAEVVRMFHREGVGTEHMVYDTKLHTGYSTILLAPKGERTILSYRGASHDLKANDINIKGLSADWFYISSLAGNLDLLSKLTKHAKNNQIKMAVNPGHDELIKTRRLRKLLPDFEVLLVNKEEARLLFGGDDIKEIMERAFGVCPYVIVTDGPEGCWVADGDKIYHAGQYQKVKVIDRTGSGDAFGSGFVAALAKGLSLDDAVTLASANSTSVVQQVGAKTGILKTARLKRMKTKAVSL